MVERKEKEYFCPFSSLDFGNLCPDEDIKPPKYSSTTGMEVAFKDKYLILLIYKELLDIHKKNMNITIDKKTKEVDSLHTHTLIHAKTENNEIKMANSHNLKNNELIL